VACCRSSARFDRRRDRQGAAAVLPWLALLPAWAQELSVVRADGVAVVPDAARLAALSATEGPWRLVVPAETRPTRWVRRVQRLSVVDAP